MNLERIGVKIFAEELAPVPVREFIPIFHGWIQKQAVPGHQLIDVHNYSHIHHGPGILLVASEANFSIDLADGKMGLFYYRKLPGAGFALVLNTALSACRLLETEPVLSGRLRFRDDELQIVANDRRTAANDDAAFRALSPELSSALQQVLKKGNWSLTRSSANPKERLTIHCRILGTDS